MLHPRVTRLASLLPLSTALALPCAAAGGEAAPAEKPAETASPFDVTLRYASASNTGAESTSASNPTANDANSAKLNLPQVDAANLNLPALGTGKLFSGVGSASPAEDILSRSVSSDVTQSVVDETTAFTSLRGESVYAAVRRAASNADISNILPNTSTVSAPASLPDVSTATSVASASVSELVKPAQSNLVSTAAAARATQMTTLSTSSPTDPSNTYVVNDVAYSWLTIVGPNSDISPGGLGHIGNQAYNGNVLLLGGASLSLDVMDTPGRLNPYSDTITITNGVLGLLASPSDSITINLYSLGLNGNPGTLNSFDPQHAYSWTFLTAPLIVGFNANEFTFDTTHFLPSVNGGSFFVSDNGNSLTINFTPVPEPSTYALFCAGLLALLGLEWRRRKN